jgi:S1-C subfamily serine protease
MDTRFHTPNTGPAPSGLPARGQRRRKPGLSAALCAACTAGALALLGCSSTSMPYVGTPPAGSTAAAGAAGSNAPPEVAGAQTGGPGAPARAPSSAAAVYRQAGASVVNITSLAVARSPFAPAAQGGGQGQALPRGTGSGFVIDVQGHIVTNDHVIEDADQLAVTFPDKTTVPATLVGRDPANDLAVVKVDPNARGDGQSVRELLRPVTLGDSDRIVVGEEAIAIGSPLGLQQTVTLGIVSAVRHPDEEIGPGQSLDLLGGAVQTDAAINPGNSGGPLFNANGEVIGVNTAGLSQSGGSIGLNFAIPVNVVKRVVPELIRSGCYRHPLIGISAIPLSQIGQAARRELGIPAAQKGLLVQEVSAGAADAGVRAGDRVVTLGGVPLRAGGDVIVAIDGRPTATGGDLRAYVENNKRPGDTVALTILRNGQRQEVSVKLSERPSDVCR